MDFNYTPILCPARVKSELKPSKSCLQVSRKILDTGKTFFGPTLEDTLGKIIFFDFELVLIYTQGHS